MADSTVNIDSLTLAQKLVLMEKLWESLSRIDELIEPPDWHGDVLRERESEWAHREQVSLDWTAAKDEIRKKTK